MKTVDKIKEALQGEVSAAESPSLEGFGEARGAVQIIPYKAEHAYHFERLNKAWIEKYFWLEETDKWGVGESA